MNAARIRIGRVKMKAGGADVRVLNRNPDGKIIERARELITKAQSFEDEPSAFVGIFFWRDDREPWRATYSIAWDTIDPNLPLPRLMRVAAAEIGCHAAMEKAEYKVMHRLGYLCDDPDPAA